MKYLLTILLSSIVSTLIAASVVTVMADDGGRQPEHASEQRAPAAVGTAYTILNTSDFSVQGVLAQILKSNELNQQYLTPRDSMRKTWNNWLRLRKRKKLPEIKPDPPEEKA